MTIMILVLFISMVHGDLAASLDGMNVGELTSTAIVRMWRKLLASSANIVAGGTTTNCVL